MDLLLSSIIIPSTLKEVVSETIPRVPAMIQVSLSSLAVSGKSCFNGWIIISPRKHTYSPSTTNTAIKEKNTEVLSLKNSSIFRFIKEIIPVPPEAFADKVLQYYQDGFQSAEFSVRRGAGQTSFSAYLPCVCREPRFAHEMVYGVGLVLQSAVLYWPDKAAAALRHTVYVPPS